MSEEDEIEQAMERLQELQTKLRKVRFDLPSFLRGLAYMDESDNVNNIFNKTVEDARIITSDLDEFIKLHQSCSKYLEVAKEEKLSRKAEQEKPVEPVNQASTTPASSQARSDALAAQRSIQNLIGGGGSVNQLNSMDDPIMLDDAGLSFVKF